MTEPEDTLSSSFSFARLLSAMRQGATKHTFRPVRWFAAFGLIAWFVVGFMTNSFEVCSSAVDGIANEFACRPPALTDAAILAPCALLLALVWPDIAEVGLFGLSVKKQLEHTAHLVEANQSTVRDLAIDVGVNRVQLQSISNSAAAAKSDATARIGDIYVGFGSPQQASDDVSEKLERLRASPNPLSRPAPRDLVDKPSNLDSAGYVVEILHLWAVLDSVFGLTNTTRQVVLERDDLLSTSARAKLRNQRKNFLLNFADDLNVLRGVRNTVAHDLPVERNQLASTVDLARKLLNAAMEFRLL